VEPYLTVRESISRNAGYYPNPRDVGEVIGLVGLTGKEKSKVKSLSGGQKRRLDLAIGIIGNPTVLFPRRADDRLRPERAARCLGGHQGAFRPWHDDPAHHSLHGRDAGARRKGRRHLPRQESSKREPPPRSADVTWLARISFALPGGYSASDLPVRAAAGENGRLVVEADDPRPE
jgi:ABC-2 type transport system ATP-binding protein